MCLHGALCSIFFMQQDHILNKLNFDLLNFDLLTPKVRGVCGLNTSFKVAAFVIPFNLICNMPCSEKMNFDLLNPSPLSRGKWGYAGKIFVTICQYS